MPHNLLHDMDIEIKDVDPTIIYAIICTPHNITYPNTEELTKCLRAYEINNSILEKGKERGIPGKNSSV